jgi:ribulose-5-phosphate 4-epimerase/fuculose-1-phosphate aldolase
MDPTHLSPAEARQELQTAGRYLLANGLAWGNAGNLSARIGPDQGLITASGTHMGELAADDFAEFAIGPGPAPAGGRKPSKEVPMHRAVYQARPEINAILHASPFYSTLLACSGGALPPDLFVEDMYYLERVARVAYAQPGTQALGELVGAQAARANVLLLENHGVLVYDTSVREALMGLHTLEMTARMVVTARSAGLDLQALPAATVAEFLERSGYRPRRQWPASEAK